MLGWKGVIQPNADAANKVGACIEIVSMSIVKKVSAGGLCRGGCWCLPRGLRRGGFITSKGCHLTTFAVIPILR